jgi:hypothetical protein
LCGVGGVYRERSEAGALLLVDRRDPDRVVGFERRFFETGIGQYYDIT